MRPILTKIKIFMRMSILMLFCLVMLGSTSFAGGYQVRLQGQKQTGIALIGTPFAYDASSIFYNPGALAMIKERYNFSLGASGIFSNHVFRHENTNYEARTDNPIGTPFYFYGSTKVTDDLSFGVGVYTPFGSSAKWDENWMGKYLIQDISLMAVFFQPTISYKLNDQISIGAGLVYATGKVEMHRALDVGSNSSVHLEGNANALGYNIGVYLKAIEKLSFGIDYRSEIIMDVEDGDATFKVPSSVQGNIPPENTFSAELPMPANLDFGLAYTFNEKFTLAAEVNWVMWSTYDSLKFTFEKAGERLNSSNPRLYEDSWIIRLGGQYKMNEQFIFRAGAYYDPTPTNKDYFNPETVSLNTVAFTLGMSWTPVDNLAIDISYLQLHGLESDRRYEPYEFGGTYKTWTIIPGFGLSYSF